MAFFGLAFWDMKNDKCLGTTIVEGVEIKAALNRAATLNLFPECELEGNGVIIGCEIPNDKLKLFPIEMFDALIPLEKMHQGFKMEEGAGLDGRNPFLHPDKVVPPTSQ